MKKQEWCEHTYLGIIGIKSNSCKPYYFIAFHPSRPCWLDGISYKLCVNLVTVFCFSCLNANIPMIKHFTEEQEMFVVMEKDIAVFLREYFFPTHVKKLLLLFMCHNVNMDLTRIILDKIKIILWNLIIIWKAFMQVVIKQPFSLYPLKSYTYVDRIVWALCSIVMNSIYTTG